MTAAYESDEIQTMIHDMEAAIAESHHPPASGKTLPALSAPIVAEDVLFRHAASDDVPQIAQLIEAADLPAWFVEEFLPGFVVADHAGDMIGCGGVEVYDDTCFIRSIVVRPDAQGLRLGRRISELLIDAARAAWVRDAYLFTMDAWPFWKHLGFVDIGVDEWKPAARQTWQYRFVAPRLHLFDGIHSMWKSIDG